MRRPNHLPKRGKESPFRELLIGRFGHTEIDHFDVAPGVIARRREHAAGIAAYASTAKGSRHCLRLAPLLAYEAAARCSPVGKFFASALHSMAVSQKLAHESGVFEARPIIGLGITNVQFPKPVVEDDRVQGRVMVKDRRLSRSRPDAGIVVLLIELLNQHHEVVLSYEVTELVPRGPRP